MNENKKEVVKTNSIKKTLIIVLSVLAVLIAGFLLFVSIPKFTLSLNNPNIKVEYSDEFKDPGAQIKFGNRIVAETIYSKDKIDTEKLGTQELKYSAKFLWRKANIKRVVTVEDTQKPVITLTPTKKLTLPNHEYEEEGFKAVDNYDGDITNLVDREEKDGRVYYTVTDSSGNTAKKVRVIVYGDETAPKLTLVGRTNSTVYKGEPYRDRGFSAIDDLDGNITSKVTVEGKVNTNIAGTYKIIYTVSDEAGNKAQAQRIVKVIERPKLEPAVPNGRVVYLTFDDGPSQHTPRLLNILKKYNVKATFFVVGSGNSNYLDDIVRGGHAIGLHTMTHNYAKIYANEEAFMREIEQQRRQIRKLTGVDTTLLRFPGGGSNTVSRRYNKGIMTRLAKRVTREGYQYFDWNVSSGDAGSTTSTQQVYYNVINGISRNKMSIVLQHDSKGYSVDAVEDIIRWGLSHGYTFKKLTPSSPTVHHPINN